MSIRDYRKELAGFVDGAERLIMNYEDGGAVEVYSIDDLSVRVRPGATLAEVRQAFIEAAP